VTLGELPEAGSGYSGRVVVVGSVNVDTVLHLERHPTPGETVAATGTARLLGGKGANQAVSAARAGATTALVCAIGDDQAGRDARDALAGAGVAVAGAARASDPTGSALVMVDGAGENMIVITPGANGLLDRDHIATAAPLVAAADVVLASLEVPVDAVLAAFAAATGLRVLNPAPAEPVTDALLDAVDVVTPNRHELGRIAGTGPPSSVESAVAMAEQLRRRHPNLAVVATLGQEGAIVVAPTGTTHLPAAPVVVVDTTGAGDAFNGRLAAELASGAVLNEAVRAGVVYASEVVGRAGATGIRLR